MFVKFIKDNGLPILVNLDRVECFSKVMTADRDAVVNVCYPEIGVPLQETIEEVEAKLDDLRMLHRGGES